MVRRRRDEAHAGRGLTHLGDPGVDLLAGQVAALAGLGALGHLDLDLDGAREVAARDAKAAARHLLDGALARVSVGKRHLAGRVLAALAGVGAPVQAVHGDGERLVGLLGDGAIAHGARVEAARDGRDGLNLVERHRRAAGVVKVEKVSQGHGAAGTVDDLAVLAEEIHVTLCARALQQVDSARLDEVLLAPKRAPLREAQARQLVGRRALGKRHRGVVALVLLALHALDGQAAHARGGGGEVAVNELVCQADDLEDLCGVITLHGRDAHLGHDRGDAGRHGAVVVGHGLVSGQVDLSPVHELADAVVGHVGVDAARRVAHEAREVMGAQRVARLHNDVGEHAHAGADEVVVDASQGEQARDGHLAVDRAV